MRDDEYIKKELTDFTTRIAPAVIFPATVTAVDTEAYTVSVELSNGAAVPDVRLRSVVKDGNVFVLIPAIDSVIQVGRIENSDEYVVMAVEVITEIKAVIDTVQFEIDNSGILLKKENDTLKQILSDIIGAVQVVVVAQGTSPDYAKLAKALTSVKNLFR